MSVLIKGIKMPTCCEECAFVRTVGLDRWKCELSGCDFNSWDVGWADGTENKYIRHSSCPLIEIPTPHGRLIDSDALLQAIIKRLGIRSREHFTPQKSFVCSMIDNSPIVIEAEEGEK